MSRLPNFYEAEDVQELLRRLFNKLGLEAPDQEIKVNGIGTDVLERIYKRHGLKLPGDEIILHFGELALLHEIVSRTQPIVNDSTLNEAQKPLYALKRLVEDKGIKKITFNDQPIIEDKTIIEAITNFLGTHMPEIIQPKKSVVPKEPLSYLTDHIAALESAGVKRKVICDFLYECGLKTTPDAIRKALKRTTTPQK